MSQIASSRRSDCGGDPPRDASKKGRGGVVGSNAYFSRPTLLIRMPTTGSRTKDGETINTKVRGKVNLIFYKLNLFPIFLVDKVKKKTEKLSFVGS